MTWNLITSDSAYLVEQTLTLASPTQLVTSAHLAESPKSLELCTFSSTTALSFLPLRIPTMFNLRRPYEPYKEDKSSISSNIPRRSAELFRSLHKSKASYFDRIFCNLSLFVRPPLFYESLRGFAFLLFERAL